MPYSEYDFFVLESSLVDYCGIAEQSSFLHITAASPRNNLTACVSA